MRDKIIEQIVSERESQITDRGFTEDKDDLYKSNDWIALLARHVGFAAKDGDQLFSAEIYRRELIRVAATAMAAIESFDRKRIINVREGSGF